MAYQSIHELMREYNTEDKCLEWFISHRWHGEIICPFCSNKDTEKKIYHFTKGKLKGRFQCGKCTRQFSVRTNSFMGESRLPLSKWLMAIYFVVNHKRGISSIQLARNIGVTQSAAWFMIHRIFNIINSDNKILKGIVEMDEVYIGGAEKNKRPDRKTQNHNKIDGDKLSVLGIIERGGKVVLQPFEGKQYKDLSHIIEQHIDKDAIVNTDESPLYKGGINGREHKQVNHSKGIYGKGNVTTNSAEGMFSNLKRMILGTHVFITKGHAKKYFDMFGFRFDTRDCSEFQRLYILMSKINGTRIMYDNVSLHGNTGTNRWYPHYGKSNKLVAGM